MQVSEGKYQDHEKTTTPVFIPLNKDRSVKSIEIVPRLGDRTRGHTGTNNDSVENTDETLATMAGLMEDSRYKHVEATLSIQVEAGQIMHPHDIVDLIQDSPLLAKSVRVQAVIPGMLTLLILSLPVAVWNKLASNRACSFVGFTTSTNLLIPNQRELQTPLRD